MRCDPVCLMTDGFRSNAEMHRHGDAVLVQIFAQNGEMMNTVAGQKVKLSPKS